MWTGEVGLARNKFLRAIFPDLKKQNLRKKKKKQALNFRWDAKENFTARVETTERRETLTSRIRY